MLIRVGFCGWIVVYFMNLCVQCARERAHAQMQCFLRFSQVLCFTNSTDFVLIGLIGIILCARAHARMQCFRCFLKSCLGCRDRRAGTTRIAEEGRPQQPSRSQARLAPGAPGWARLAPEAPDWPRFMSSRLAQVCSGALDMPTYTHTYLHTSIHTYIHTYRHTYTRTHRHTQTHTDTHIRTHTHTQRYRDTEIKR